MWSDNETNRDFLNFRAVADTAAEIIFRAGKKPLSMGVSGGWGGGKSSMVQLNKDPLRQRFGDDFVFVEFNTWRCPGSHDAKAALLEVAAQGLLTHGEKYTKNIERPRAFLSYDGQYRRGRWGLSSAKYV